MAGTEKNSITFPSALSNALDLLQERWFMSPNLLSDYIGEKLISRAVLPAVSRKIEKRTLADYTVPETHALNLSEHQGRQVLKVSVPGAQKYNLYFAGNMQDLLERRFVESVIAQEPHQNHIFENYPGVGDGQKITYLSPMFQAGYQQVKALISEGVKPEDITLSGVSLGGGVAAEIGKRLQQEGIRVNLKLQATFSSLSAIPSPLIEGLLEKNPELKKKYRSALPLLSTAASGILLGASVGTGVAGLIASVGVLTASLVASIGYYTSLALALVPGLELPASLLNELFNQLSIGIHTAINYVASAMGALVGLVGALAGTLVGSILGAFFSLQLLYTDKPVLMPLDFAARCFLNTTIGEMSSARSVQYMLDQEKHGRIEIKHSKQDEIIYPKASLNTGLGLSDDPQRPNKQGGFGKNFLSMWYKVGEHNDRLEDENIDHSLTSVGLAV